MNWYVERDGSPSGPYSTEDASALLQEMNASSETLVWRDGLDGWERAAQQPEFALSFPKRPPPLPKREPALPTSQAMSPALPLGESATIPIAEDEPFGLTPASLALPPSSPWSRYFARQIDLSLLGFSSMFALGAALPFISMQAHKSFVNMNNATTGVLAVAVAVFLNASVISLFGNSLGKRIFGLKAVPSDVTRSANAFWIFMREGRVWFYGLGLGIPIVSLFTIGRNHKEVKAGRPARYDRDQAEVLETPISKARRVAGMLFGGSLIVGLLALNMWIGERDRQMALPKSWTNPASRQTTQIPGGWSYDPANSTPSKQVYAFSNADGTEAVFLGVEPMPDVFRSRTNSQGYAEILEQALAQNVEFRGEWQPGRLGGRDMLFRNALMKSNGWHGSFAVWQQGNLFWRVMALSATASQPPRLTQMDIVPALLSSVPIER